MSITEELLNSGTYWFINIISGLFLATILFGATQLFPVTFFTWLGTNVGWYAIACAHDSAKPKEKSLAEKLVDSHLGNNVDLEA